MLRSTVAPPDGRGVQLTSAWMPSSAIFHQPKHSHHEATFSTSGATYVDNRYPDEGQTVKVKVKVGKDSPPPSAGWNPRASMAYDSAKGLLNPVGENNCFLNSAIQVLWNLDAFRRNFRLLSGHACMGSSCIFCELKALFTQYQFGNCPALPAYQLRDALAQTFAEQQRYQLGVMDDAAECFENILMRIHVHLANGVSEDTCQEPHCIPHQKFSMTVVEQAVCQCEATCEPFSFSQIVHYVSTCAVIDHARSTQHGRRPRISFGNLLSSAASDAESRRCPKNCGGRVSLRRTLTNTPEVISIGFVWDSDRPSSKHINRVVSSIGTVLHPADMFYSVVDAEWAVSTKFRLVGVVCYYGQHYTTFFFHSKMKIWILFDDSRVKKLGPDWKCVAERCCRGRYQPLLLLYANPDGQTVDVTTAPTCITQIRHRVTERPRDVTRRSLLPPRDNDSDISHSQQLAGNETAQNGLHGMPPSNNHRKSYLNALNEIDEGSEVDYCDTTSSTSNYDTLSSMTSSSSRSSSATLRQQHDQDGSRLCSTADVQVDPHVGGCSSKILRPTRDVAQSFKSMPDDSDSEPYITTDKVQKVFENQARQVFGRTSNRGDGSRSVAASDTCSVRSGDYLDSLSLMSHKDSGYRSSEDRHESVSMRSSPTMSASESAHSLEGGIAVNGPRYCGSSKSMCSSLDSLSSIRTGLSLPVSYERQTSAHRATAETTSGRLKSTEHTVKPVNYGVPFTYGLPNMQVLGDRVEQQALHTNMVDIATKQTKTSNYGGVSLTSGPPVTQTNSRHVINGRQLATEPSNNHVNKTAKQSQDSAQFYQGNSSNYPNVSEAVLLMKQPINHQTAKHDQSERSAPVVKHMGHDQSERSAPVVKHIGRSTPDARPVHRQQTAKFQQLERPAQELLEATGFQAPNYDYQLERPAKDAMQVNNYPAVKSDMFQRPAQLNNYSAQGLRQGITYPAADSRQGNNYPAQDLKQGYNYLPQDVRLGNSYSAQDVRMGNTYQARDLKQGNNYSSEDVRLANGHQVAKHSELECSIPVVKHMNQYHAARYEQYERPAQGPNYQGPFQEKCYEGPIQRPSHQGAKYEPPRRQPQGPVTLNSELFERSGHFGPVLLAKVMPELVTIGRQCDRAEVELRPPTGQVSQAMNRVVRVPEADLRPPTGQVSQAMNRVVRVLEADLRPPTGQVSQAMSRGVRVLEADIRATSNINAVPSYPYKGNPGVAQNYESKKEVSSADSEPVLVKGRRCVTPVGGSRIALPSNSRPPSSANSRETPSRQDLAKSRPSHVVPAAKTSQSSVLHSKAKSVSNLSSKPAWKN